MAFTYKKAFTLTELLVSMAIIGILVAVMVPVVNRSLTDDKLGLDIKLLQSKIREVRLLAGSVQQSDRLITNQVGYYALYVPRFGNKVGVLKLSTDLNAKDGAGAPARCSVRTAIDEFENDTAKPKDTPCVIERIDLSSGVKLGRAGNGEPQLIAFKVPQEEPYLVYQQNGNWGSQFNWLAGAPNFKKIQLTYNRTWAEVTVNSYTVEFSGVQFGSN